MWYLLHFFTFWSLIFVVLHTYTARFLDLRYMTFIVLVIGSYLSFVNPGSFKFIRDDGNVDEYRGWRKFLIIDIAMHLCVFIYIWVVQQKTGFDISTFLCTHILLIVYLSTVNVERVYGVPFSEVFIVFMVTNILFSLFVIKRYK